MLVDDFDYQLPQDLIAQTPPECRDSSRLMTLNRATGQIDEGLITDIAALFRAGDILVINNTKVIPARLNGFKESGGKAEIFLVRSCASGDQEWICLIGCSKRPRPGTVIHLPEGVAATVCGQGEGETWRVRFSNGDDFWQWLERHGSMPLPPYIRRCDDESDRERYQTVFAQVNGAVAAPTAGLHFSSDLLAAVGTRGVDILPLTLHVGLGTFMPIRVERVEDHRMHREQYSIPEETARAINQRRRDGGRVVALGTTVARTLEFAAREDGTLPAGSGEADIFIYPGYRFKAVDVLITNFHLPKSTLLMLVSAFAGQELLFRAYNEAIARRFRFFSYGDAMFIF